MSDILVNACDENWWFGDTVKDFNAHRYNKETFQFKLLHAYVSYFDLTRFFFLSICTDFC